MSSSAPRLTETGRSLSKFEQIRAARSIIKEESRALSKLADRLDAEFCAAVSLVNQCRGRLVVTGMGKAGLIGQKISATLSSTGTPSQFLHPAEAVHGDLGCLHEGDVLLALSNSGETEEVSRMLSAVQRIQVPIIAITSSRASTLGQNADVVLAIGRFDEAGIHGLAPTTSTTSMLALGDALALVASHVKGFTPRHFAMLHPAGTLGRKLMTVREVMRSRDELRIAMQTDTIRSIFIRLGKPGRRSGAMLVTDDELRLIGIFTDSDLARLFERDDIIQFDRPIVEVMTCNPLTIAESATLMEAVEILSTKKVSELPVIDIDGRPVGLIDITDVIGLMPQDASA